jgi:hypothetical protein
VVRPDELLYDAVGHIRRGRAATRVGRARAAFLQDGVHGPFPAPAPQSAAALLLFTDSHSSVKRCSGEVASKSVGRKTRSRASIILALILMPVGRPQIRVSTGGLGWEDGGGGR